MAEEREREEKVNFAFNISADSFANTLRSFRELPLGADETRLEELRNVSEKINRINMVVNYIAGDLMRPWQGDATQVTPITGEAYARAVDARIYEVIMRASKLASHFEEEFMTKLERYVERNDVKLGREVVAAWAWAFDSILLLQNALVVATQGIIGASTANLPISIMPNTIKGRSGIITD